MWNCGWRREPRGREIGELEELERELLGWEPNRDRKDLWEWEFEKNKMFSVRKLRELMVERSGGGLNGDETLWAAIVPKKVNVFMWRLRRGKLPTRVALNNMGIDLHSMLCPMCGEER